MSKGILSRQSVKKVDSRRALFVTVLEKGRARRAFAMFSMAVGVLAVLSPVEKSGAIIGGIDSRVLVSSSKNLIVRNTVRFILNVDGKEEQLCSGVIIGDGEVLTAAHCFKDDDVRQALRSGSLSMRYFEPGGEGRFASVLVESDSVSLPRDKNVDLAFVRLPVAFPNKENLLLAYGGCAPGSPYIVAGYGTTRESTSPSDLDHLSLHSVKMKKVGEGEGATTLLEETFDKTSGKSNGMGCFGDSGGPTFCKSKAGQWILAGINHKVYPRAKARRGKKLSGREQCESSRVFRSAAVKWNMDLIEGWRRSASPGGPGEARLSR